MRKYLGLLFGLLIAAGVFAQEVKGIHKVSPSGEANGYNIKTTISGLQGVDIARIIYLIDETHTYKAAPTNTFFSDRNEKFIKFYVMAVPATGEINVDLGVVVANAGEFAFQVEFQYSKNEEKKTIDLPRVYLTSDEEMLAEEPVQVSVDEELVANAASEQKAKEEAEAAKLAEEAKAKEVAAEKEAEAIALKEASEQKAKEESEAAKLAEEAKAKEVATQKAAEELALQEELEQKAKEEAEAAKLAEEAKEVAAEKEAEALALKEASEQKAREESEAAKLAEEAKAKEVATQKAAEELALQEELEQKAKEEAESLASLKEVKSNSVEPKERTPIKGYTIQLLSLSKFSQDRLDYYCKQNKLDSNKIRKKRSGDWMKITYGEFSSKEEASAQVRKLNSQSGIDGAFVTTFR